MATLTPPMSDPNDPNDPYTTAYQEEMARQQPPHMTLRAWLMTKVAQFRQPSQEEAPEGLRAALFAIYHLPFVADVATNDMVERIAEGPVEEPVAPADVAADVIEETAPVPEGFIGFEADWLRAQRRHWQDSHVNSR